MTPVEDACTIGILPGERAGDPELISDIAALAPALTIAVGAPQREGPNIASLAPAANGAGDLTFGARRCGEWRLLWSGTNAADPAWERARDTLGAAVLGGRPDVLLALGSAPGPAPEGSRAAAELRALVVDLAPPPGLAITVVPGDGIAELPGGSWGELALDVPSTPPADPRAATWWFVELTGEAPTVVGRGLRGGVWADVARYQRDPAAGWR